jgi:hypothetical protein
MQRSVEICRRKTPRHKSALHNPITTRWAKAIHRHQAIQRFNAGLVEHLLV